MASISWALASSTTSGRACRWTIRTTSSSSPSTNAIAPTVKSTTRATRPMTDVKVSSKWTRFRATRPISERIVAS